MSFYENVLTNLYQSKNTAVLQTIAAIISQSSTEIAKNFYQEMLSHPQAANFLNHDAVKKRLTTTMATWIVGVFLCGGDKESIKAHINYQKHVGKVHANIGLPVHLVNYGMYLIKKDVFATLYKSALGRDELAQAMMLTNHALDCALQIINESYENDLVNNEKNTQAFKIQFTTHHLAFDCERLRTSLSEWMRDLLFNTQQENFEIESLLTIRQSNFGLWIAHKAKLFLANRQEYLSLVKLLDDMDECLQELVKNFDSTQERILYLKQLNELVSQANWVLGEVAKEIIDQDNGRDTLTRLFNRRYLDTVMRHETASCLKSGTTFGVLIIDIDFFKKINDTYGHDNGDRVLAQLAEILTHEVRAGDFIFRLGGEEFLIVLGEVNPQVLSSVAEKIRLTVANASFNLSDKKTLHVTVSIGTAIHDGHPDFHRTIKQADDALYQSKHNGRNQVTAANIPVLTYKEITN